MSPTKIVGNDVPLVFMVTDVAHYSIAHVLIMNCKFIYTRLKTDALFSSQLGGAGCMPP